MARRTGSAVRAYNREAMDRVRGVLEGFSETKLRAAANRATVSTIRRALPIAKRDIRERHGIADRALGDKIKAVENVDRRGDKYLGINASSREMSLIDFGGRWRGTKSVGASASIRIGQAKVYASAFIATIKGLKAIRVRRFTNGPGSKRHGRGPVRILRGPSPFEMLLGEYMLNGNKVAAKILDVYSAEIKRQLQLLRDKKL